MNNNSIRSLLKHIYPQGMSITFKQLVNNAYSTFNHQLLTEDFWYLLIWTYIDRMDGDVFSDLLVKCFKEIPNAPLLIYERYRFELSVQPNPDELLKELVDSAIYQSPYTDIYTVMRDFEPRFRYAPKEFEFSKKLYKALFMKMNNISETQYDLVDKLTNELTEDCAADDYTRQRIMIFYRSMGGK